MFIFKLQKQYSIILDPNLIRSDKFLSAWINYRVHFSLPTLVVVKVVLVVHSHRIQTQEKSRTSIVLVPEMMRLEFVNACRES